MPEVTISIGGRAFEVSCQDGEEHFLQAAAKMLDTEAQVLTQQIGRMPESRMLLMAGLMLADKTAVAQDKTRTQADLIRELSAQIDELRNRPLPAPERVEVPVIPSNVTDVFADMTAQAEAIADSLEERAKANNK